MEMNYFESFTIVFNKDEIFVLVYKQQLLKVNYIYLLIYTFCIRQFVSNVSSPIIIHRICNNS